METRTPISHPAISRWDNKTTLCPLLFPCKTLIMIMNEISDYKGPNNHAHPHFDSFFKILSGCPKVLRKSDMSRDM